MGMLDYITFVIKCVNHSPVAVRPFSLFLPPTLPNATIQLEYQSDVKCQ